MPQPKKPEYQPEKEVKSIDDSLIPKTKEEWIDFLIRNTAYPYWSASRKKNIIFGRIKKHKVTDKDLFKEIIEKGAVKTLGLKTEEDCKLLRNRITVKLHEKREYKPTIKDWPEEDRPREILIKHGAEKLSPAQLLAIILRLGESRERASAEDLGKILLNRFGGFRGLDTASISDLCSIKGIGPAKAAQIKAALQIGRRFTQIELKPGKKYRTSKDIVDHYMPYMRDLKKETFKIILLDGKNKFINDITISEGSLTDSIVHPREVIKEVVKESAAAIILVHNHPSGEPEPSQDDLNLTHRLIQACDLVGIRILDHIILGADKYYSFLDKGLIKEE